MLKQACAIFGPAAFLLVTAGGRTCWQNANGIVEANVTSTDGQHGGEHDFDFLQGKWRIHNRRLLHPLTGSSDWVEFDGTSVAKKAWDGRASMDEYEADGPSGHIEGMTVRIFNSQSHEWSLYWANSRNGAFSLPATVGHFTNGRGEFFDHEEIEGRPVLVRFVWESVTPKRCHWDQAFSTDEGTTWETNWTMDFTRVEGVAL